MARILIVEDEPIVAWNIEEILKIFNYDVIGIVDSGNRAIRIARETKPDLVLMDIRLQGDTDGIAAAEQIYNQLNIPVVYVTAHADEQTLQQAIATAPFGYVLKPFNRLDLYTALETALRRHRLEQEQNATRRWFVAMLKSIGDGAIAIDTNGHITFMNAVAESLTGWQESDALGKLSDQVLNFFHAKTGKQVDNFLLQAIQENIQLSCPDDCVLLTKDGRERAIGDLVAPIKDEQGKIVGAILVFQDITERKQAQASLQNMALELERQVQERTARLRSATKFEATLKRITDRVRDSLDEKEILQTAIEELVRGLDICGGGTALFNFAGGTLNIDHEYTMTTYSTLATGVSLEEFSDILPQLKADESLQFCELKPRPTTSTWPHQTILTCPLLDDQGLLGDLWLFKAVEETFDDLEIRLAQQAANQCAIAIRQARLYQTIQSQVDERGTLNRLKDDFLSTLSHELRTPMSNIKMASRMLEIVLQRLGMLDREPSLARYLRIIEDEGQREINLINDLLDLSLLDAGVEPLLPTLIDLRLWIPHIAEPFIERAHKQQQQLNIDLPDQLPVLTTDLLYLERILNELLENACKYTPANEQIIVSACAIPDGVQLSITNTGVEIPPQERDRIFDKFHRIPNNDPWKQSGIGLGLALVKKLVEHLGGKVQVDSHDSRTTFALLLPTG
jgi:PAS domain S-box-containing protein